MKKHVRAAVSIALCLLLLLSLSACGNKGNAGEDVYRTDFDYGLYDLNSLIDGVSFIVPKEYYENSASYDDYDAYSLEEKLQTPFVYHGDSSWSLFQKSKFGEYAFDVGTIDHIEGKEDVNLLASYLRISDYVTFSPREDELGGEHQSGSDTDTGDIVNFYPVMIHDELTEDDLYGYLVTYRRGDNRYVYALCCGFTTLEEETDAMAKTICQSLLPNDRVTVDE